MSAIATGALCVKAWYQAQANAGIQLGNHGSGSLTTEASSLDVQKYSINFSIDLADNDDKLELSHVVTAETRDAVVSAGVTGAAIGDLVYGGVYNGNVKLKKATATTNLITTYTVSAVWASNPTDSAEIEFLNGKYFTATLTKAANARFVENGVDGLSNSDTATVVFQISYTPAQNEAPASWSFTASNYSLAGIHVEPTNVTSATLDSNTEGSVSVTAVSDLRDAA